MKVRYSREREFGAAPWKEMKINCAISSRRGIGLSHLRTTGLAFSTAGEGFDATAVLEAALRGTAALSDAAPQVRVNARITVIERSRGNATISVSQIYRPDAVMPVPRRVPFCEPGGFLAGRFTRRRTARTRWAGSFALLETTASAPVFSS